MHIHPHLSLQHFLTTKTPKMLKESLQFYKVGGSAPSFKVLLLFYKAIFCLFAILQAFFTWCFTSVIAIINLLVLLLLLFWKCYSYHYFTSVTAIIISQVVLVLSMLSICYLNVPVFLLLWLFIYYFTKWADIPYTHTPSPEPATLPGH